MTLKEMIELALVIVGFLAEGEEASPEAMLDGIRLTNQMLGSWSIDNLIVPVISRETFTVPSQQSVTIGPDCDLDTSPFTSIVGLTITSNEGVSREITIVAEETIRAIPSVLSCSIPSLAAFLPSYPTGTLLFSGIPDAPLTALVRMTRPFDQLSELTAEIEFPPGYELAVQFGIPVLMASKYGRPIRQDVVAIANEAYDKIKTKNAENRGVPLAEFESALCRRSAGSTSFFMQ